MLAYEKLDVYQCAIEFLSLATALMRDAKRGDGPLIDQLQRASMAITLNIAESAGRTGPNDRARFYGITPAPRWSAAPYPTFAEFSADMTRKKSRRAMPCSCES